MPPWPRRGADRRGASSGEDAMRVQRAVLAASIAVGVAVPVSTAGAANDPVDVQRGLKDRDVRTQTIAPTAAQRSDARALGAQVAWNDFGTPSTLVDAGGALATGVAGDTAAAAAKTWLGRNTGLYKLSSTAGLELLSDNKLAASSGHAVTFQQVVGGRPAAGGGLVTVGVTRTGRSWKVVSASSSLSGDETLAGKAALSAEEGLQRAASDAGLTRSLAQIRSVAAKVRST